MPYKVDTFQDSLGNEFYLVIDTIFKGVSGGGIRIHNYVTLEEVIDLARNMSCKLAIYDLPFGGAKIGIRLKDITLKSEALSNLKAYLKNFIKNYPIFFGKDLGISEEEVESIRRGVMWQKCKSHSSYYTSVGLVACLKFIKSQYGLKDIKVALSGFGRVGYFFAEKLTKLGVKLVAISNQNGCVYSESGLDINELLKAQSQYNNDEWIFHTKHKMLPRETLYTLPVDILIPGAEAYAINSKNICDLKTRFICPVANIPYHHEIISELKKKGIIFFPDFVCNGGGVLGSHFLNWGFSLREAERLVAQEITKTLCFLYSNTGNNHYELALKLAGEKIKMRNNLENNFKKNKVYYLLRSYFRAIKHISPRFLLKNYYNFRFVYYNTRTNWKNGSEDMIFK
jgi:glutamate dehydrogenase